MCVHPKTYKKFALQVGSLFALAFVACFAWYWIRGGGAELQTLHLNSLKLAFFGFTGMNLASFVAGLVQSFIWGLIAVGLWRLAGICCGFPGHKSGATADHGDGECCKA